MFYKSNPRAKVKAMNIPKCGIRCALNDLYELYDDIIPKSDYDTECKLRDGESLPAEGNPEAYAIA